MEKNLISFRANFDFYFGFRAKSLRSYLSFVHFLLFNFKRRAIQGFCPEFRTTLIFNNDYVMRYLNSWLKFRDLTQWSRLPIRKICVIFSDQSDVFVGSMTSELLKSSSWTHPRLLDKIFLSFFFHSFTMSGMLKKNSTKIQDPS